MKFLQKRYISEVAGVKAKTESFHVPALTIAFCTLESFKWYWETLQHIRLVTAWFQFCWSREWRIFRVIFSAGFLAKVCINTWLPTGRIIEIWKRELLYVVKNVWCLSSPRLSGYRNTSGCPRDLSPNNLAVLKFAGLLYGAHTVCVCFWSCHMLLEEFSPLSLANDPVRCFLNLFLFHHPYLISCHSPLIKLQNYTVEAVTSFSP